MAGSSAPGRSGLEQEETMTEPMPLDLFETRKGGIRDLLFSSSKTGLVAPRLEFPELPGAGDPPPSGRVRLAIDFGTSAISLALIDGDQVAPLVFDTSAPGRTSPILESSIALRTGLDKARLGDNYHFYDFAPVALDRESGWSLFPCLKRRIELLARKGNRKGWQDNAILDVAAICMGALDRAREPATGKPLRKILDGRSFHGPVFLSIPNSFPGPGVDVLRRGIAFGVAASLGMPELPEVETLLEAEAVAYREFTLLKGRGSAPPDIYTLLVIDAGAGTTDASVVRLENDMFRVIAHTGLPVGGLDLDALITQCGKPISQIEPEQLFTTIRRSGELKVLHWSSHASPAEATGSGPSITAKTGELATAILPDASVAADAVQQLEGGYRRFLALGVRALIQGLRLDEIGPIDRVVLSGRGSLLLGFPEAVREVLSRSGIHAEISAANSGIERKLSVVLGVADYSNSPRSQIDRRPRRAGHDLVLRHQMRHDRCLVETGALLLDGWAVTTWQQPGINELGTHRSFIDNRMISERVLRKLHEFHGSEQERLALDVWCRRQVSQVAARPPFTAWCAYDYLSQKFVCQVDGRPSFVEPADVESTFEIGRPHPVHGAPEDWFERFMGERK
jgi:hypothetical protein